MVPTFLISHNNANEFNAACSKIDPYLSSWPYLWVPTVLISDKATEFNAACSKTDPYLSSWTFLWVPTFLISDDNAIEFDVACCNIDHYLLARRYLETPAVSLRDYAALVRQFSVLWCIFDETTRAKAANRLISCAKARYKKGAAATSLTLTLIQPNTPMPIWFWRSPAEPSLTTDVAEF